MWGPTTTYTFRTYFPRAALLGFFKSGFDKTINSESPHIMSGENLKSNTEQPG